MSLSPRRWYSPAGQESKQGGREGGMGKAGRQAGMESAGRSDSLRSGVLRLPQQHPYSRLPTRLAAHVHCQLGEAEGKGV
jgi:hypothetical protein